MSRGASIASAAGGVSNAILNFIFIYLNSCAWQKLYISAFHKEGRSFIHLFIFVTLLSCDIAIQINIYLAADVRQMFWKPKWCLRLKSEWIHWMEDAAHWRHRRIEKLKWAASLWPGCLMYSNRKSVIFITSKFYDDPSMNSKHRSPISSQCSSKRVPIRDSNSKFELFFNWSMAMDELTLIACKCQQIQFQKIYIEHFHKSFLHWFFFSNLTRTNPKKFSFSKHRSKVIYLSRKLHKNRTQVSYVCCIFFKFISICFKLSSSSLKRCSDYNTTFNNNRSFAKRSSIYMRSPLRQRHTVC